MTCGRIFEVISLAIRNLTGLLPFALQTALVCMNTSQQQVPQGEPSEEIYMAFYRNCMAY